MIKKLIITESPSLHPYYNQAVEASLLELADSETMILYIWANDKTVFIGKNQNAYAECNIQALNDAGGFLARRISGGGAVYHDRGNLNFTFVCTKSNYSLKDNFEIVLAAVESFGISAELSGRNDCTIDGKKFSGNAFYSSDDKCFHHGTVLINTMSGEIAKYLNVSNVKLNTKGVKSVVSRVTNLCAHNPSVTFDDFGAALRRSFIRHWSKRYGNEGGNSNETISVIRLATGDIEPKLMKKWQDFFTDESRIMGDDIDYNFRLEQRFDWGVADIRLQLNGGIIQKVKIYTDSLDYDITKKEAALIGKNICSFIECDVSDILSAANEAVSKT